MTGPAADLATLWTRRDNLYRGWRRPLTESEAAAVRWYRAKEARELVGTDRLRALAIADAWQPPR